MKANRKCPSSWKSSLRYLLLFVVMMIGCDQPVKTIALKDEREIKELHAKLNGLRDKCAIMSKELESLRAASEAHTNMIKNLCLRMDMSRTLDRRD